MSYYFAWLSRLKFIQRWSLMRNLIREIIWEHNLQVGMISHSLEDLLSSPVIRSQRS